MKALCCIAAAAALLASAPAMAQQAGTGYTTNIWSSSQGTANSFGGANGFSYTEAGSMANAGNIGSNALINAGVSAGNLTQAITMSNSTASSSGSGYAQTQTSGYAGGSVTTYHSH